MRIGPYTKVLTEKIYGITVKIFLWKLCLKSGGYCHVLFSTSFSFGLKAAQFHVILTLGCISVTTERGLHRAAGPHSNPSLFRWASVWRQGVQTQHMVRTKTRALLRAHMTVRSSKSCAREQSAVCMGRAHGAQEYSVFMRLTGSQRELSMCVCVCDARRAGALC